jgi:WD40 repeat protein
MKPGSYSVPVPKDRIARARALLRARLTRRGIELPAALAVPLLASGVAPAAPARLCAGLRSAFADVAHRRPPGAGVSPTGLALARTEVAAVSFTRAAVLFAAAAGLVAAGALAGRPLDPGTPPAVARAADPPAPAAENAPPHPAGAVRIGSTRFRAEAGWHKKVYFTADGNTIVAPLEGKSVELWNPESGLRAHAIPVPNAHFYDSDYFANGDLLALVGFVIPDDRAAAWQLTVWFVDTAARKLVRSVPLPDVEHSVRHTVRFTPDGKRLFVSLDDQIRVLDVKSGDELIRQKHKEWPDVFAVSPDGKTVVFGHFNLFLWNWAAGEEPKKLVSIGGFGSELAAFGPDDKTLYVASHGGRIVTFDTADGRQTGTLNLGETAHKWSFSPDGKTLAVSYYESTRNGATGHAVVLWDPATGKQLGRLSLGRASAGHVSWSPDGARLATATDYRLWVWDAKAREPLGPAEPGHEGSIGAFAFGPDGRLYTAGDDHTVRSWDVATGKPVLELTHDYWVRDVAVSPDGALVVGSALRNDLRVWDAKTGAERFKLLGNGWHGGQRKVRFTPDGKRLVAWGDDLYLRLWDTRNGKLLAEHLTLPDGITEEQLGDERGSFEMRFAAAGAADISADGSAFVIGSHAGTVQVFDTDTGKPRGRFEADPNGIGAVALSPDGKRLLAAGQGKWIETRLPDGKLRNDSAPEHRTAVWDLATKRVLWEATAPGSWPRGVAYSADGKRIAAIESRDDRHAVRVRDADSGTDLGRIDLPGPCFYCTFDRTGKKLAVAHRDTTATVYDLEQALKK